ncbi:MAG: glycosyltransferase family 2 protein [Patescibacteria group bacterium]|nr:glycosyltransferase family 2 protein [Patescibacteria group bacterium]MDE1965894.1 glycosyltransferase family 2 protein [Patescibacteria group bacterium]
MQADWFMYPLLFLSLYFEVFVLLSFLEGWRAPKASHTQDALPSVTVFVPCYNEEHTVARTIDSLLALDYPKELLAVFAINDGSTDGTAAVLARYAGHPQVTVFEKENGGKHTALNLGLAHATTEIVGCLDADSFVAPDALREMARCFADPTVMSATPAIKVHEPKGVVARVQHAEYAMSAFVRRTFAWLEALFITPGPFSLFRREVFLKLGPYRSAYNTEDMEVALRMQREGMRIENVPTAHVFTTAPSTYASLYRQRVRWTYGFLKNARDYRDMFLNPRYGTLGMFILPLGLFTVFPSIFLMAFSVADAAGNAVDAARRISVVGFSAPHFSLDWFYLDTRAIVFLMLAIIVLATVTIAIGRKLMGERHALHPNVVLYLLLYGFMAPFWLARASYNVIASRERTWSSEIDARRKRD